MIGGTKRAPWSQISAPMAPAAPSVAWATFIVLACTPILGVPAAAQDKSPDGFSAQQIRRGADIYERNCSPCHGPHMLDPQGAFNLRSLASDQHDRFVNSVTHGKNQMPPWGDMLAPDEIEALWAYVRAGER